MIRRASKITLSSALVGCSRALGGVLGIIKRSLIKRWTADVVSHLRSELAHQPSGEINGNRAGLGGQEFKLKTISWRELFDQSPDLHSWAKRPRAVKEHLFFAYFGPLEAWCERNCQGPFYLWTTETGICLHITDPVDMVVWKMTWDGEMPTLAEIEKLVF
jgi:hypothetical protein